MLYKDQLVLTGKLNDVGDAIRINVPKSYRLGLEAWGGTQINQWLRVEGNITVSENKLRNYEDYVPHYDQNFDFIGYQTLHFSSSQISFSPWLTAFGSIAVQQFKNLELLLNTKAVSKKYLDNTQSEYKKINGYLIQDLQANYAFNKKDKTIAELILQVNNIWNKKYEANGYTYSYFYDTSLVKENFYYPMAGINWTLGLNIKL
jgi:iron complex outermembrane receptor protein